MAKILILGGTGAIGAHLSNILSSKNHDVVVTSRRFRKSSESLRYVQGNARDLGFLNQLFKEKWDVVVDFMIYSTEEFNQRADMFLNNTKHYFFMSSSRVYSNSSKPLSEDSSRLLESSKDSAYLKTTEYALSKARQEDILRDTKKKNYTIIRPYITYGEKRLQLGSIEKEGWLYRALKGRTIVFSKDIRDSFTTLTYGLDVAEAIAKLIDSKKTVTEIYNVTCSYSLTWGEVQKIYLDVFEKKMGYRPKVVYQNSSEFRDWNSKYKVIYDRAYDRKFDNSKMCKITGKNSFVKPTTGLRRCLSEFLDNPEFLSINWRKEAAKDRFTKEMASFEEIKGLKNQLIYLLFRFFIKNNGLTILVLRKLKNNVFMRKNRI